MISKVFLQLKNGSFKSIHPQNFQAQFLSKISDFITQNKIHASLCGQVNFGKDTVFFEIDADKKLNHGHIQYYFSAPLYSIGWMPVKGERKVFSITVL